jgi:dynein heavy chain
MFEICIDLEANSSGGGGGGGESGAREKGIELTATDILKKLETKGLFDLEGISMTYPIVYEESMNTVLLQECIRYNKLIQVMLDTLPLVLKALNGLVVMSTELDSIANAIFLNAVPTIWSDKAYPSMKNCLSWAADLDDRLHFVHTWIENGVPSVFWISGFYFPQAFLTGSLQNFARKMQYPIDTVSFDFVIVEDHWETLTARPENGVYIRGLFLEGARWDSAGGCINDSLPKSLYTELSVLHLNPKRNRKEVELGIYRCPVYKILSRRGTLSTTGHSTNFIMWIELPSNRTDIKNNMGLMDQEEWIRAGVAAFSSLMY